MLVGLTRFELVTPRLSSVCSNQLSYRPRYSLQNASKNQVAGSLKTRQACNTQNPERQIDLQKSASALAGFGETL